MPFRNGTYVITDIDRSESVGAGASQLSSLNLWLEFQGFKLKHRNSFDNKASLAFNKRSKCVGIPAFSRYSMIKALNLLLTSSKTVSFILYRLSDSKFSPKKCEVK